MNMAKLEMTVGVFMLIGILCLGYISIKLGKMEIMGGDYYAVSAEFDSVSGLKPGARVEVAGVEIGKVDRISLDPKSGDRAVAHLGRSELMVRSSHAIDDPPYDKALVVIQLAIGKIAARGIANGTGGRVRVRRRDQHVAGGNAGRRLDVLPRLDRHAAVQAE